MALFAEVPRRPEYPGSRLFRECHAYLKARCRKCAIGTSIRFPLLFDTGHSVCHRSTADLLRTWRHDPGPLAPAWKPLHLAKMSSWKKKNLGTRTPDWNSALHSPREASAH